MQGLEVGLLLWRAQLQMFLNQTIRSGKPGRIAGTIIAAAVIVLAWAWEAFVTWLAIQAAHRCSCWNAIRNGFPPCERNCCSRGV